MGLIMYYAIEANKEVEVQLEAMLTSTAPRRVNSLRPRSLYFEEPHDMYSIQYSWAPNTV